MKVSTSFIGVLATLTVAQILAPYTDTKSGITFNAFQQSSGMFFGLTLPMNSTGNIGFIATIGGKGSGYSGISFGGGILWKLLFVAWPNQQNVVGSFRKPACVPRLGKNCLRTRAKPVIGTSDLRRSQLELSPSRLSPTVPTSIAFTGLTPSSAQTVSKPMAPFLRQQTLHQASATC
jgi:hypothetical protein